MLVAGSGRYAITGNDGRGLVGKSLVQIIIEKFKANSEQTENRTDGHGAGIAEVAGLLGNCG